MSIELRKPTDRGGYYCMPLKKNVPQGHNSWQPAICPECQRECWKLPLAEIAEASGAKPLCTECALKKRSDKLMGEGICQYAIPMKPPYEFPFACAVMYECRWKNGGKNMHKSCPRFQIGENMEQSGQELKDPSVQEVVIQKHSAIGKSDQMLELLGVLTKGEVK